MSQIIADTLKLIADNQDIILSAVRLAATNKETTMATLKISDISVGDWVNVMTEKLTSLVFCEEIEIARGYIHSQIKGIREDGYIAVEAADGRYTLVNLGCIEPIPITAEILVKNGFVRRSTEFPIYEYTTLLGKMLRTTVVNLNHPYNYILCRIEDTSKEFHELERTPVNSSIDRNPIHIHDLQHALRLAGIDKEINL